MIDFADFTKLDIRVGTIVEAIRHPQASKPAFVLSIDFGPLGNRTSSAQITEGYAAQDLVGMQVTAVVNFPPKRIAGVKSEVLVLASVSEQGTVLLTTTHPVPNGSRVA